ncbi:MAG: UDP-N-acetylglucosamine 2-epimerase [Chloracidobacterium sp.]|nr:UDP-N-acetylglucosamine 2-epimerase [Chloracidobacterium sp.]
MTRNLKIFALSLSSTKRSAEYLIRMGRAARYDSGTGRPSSDLALCLNRTLTEDIVNSKGRALTSILPNLLLVVFHPTTTNMELSERKSSNSSSRLEMLRMPTIFLWPNIDAGSDHISKAIRLFRDHRSPGWLRTLTNLTPENYLRVLAGAATAIGNSSSFVRDASFWGHQSCWLERDERQGDGCMLCMPPVSTAISDAVRAQISHGRYVPSVLYGDGQVAERIADALALLTPYRQKKLAYEEEDRAMQSQNGADTSSLTLAKLS